MKRYDASILVNTCTVCPSLPLPCRLQMYNIWITPEAGLGLLWEVVADWMPGDTGDNSQHSMLDLTVFPLENT